MSEFSNSQVLIERSDGSLIRRSGHVKDDILYCSHFDAVGEFTVYFKDVKFSPTEDERSISVSKGIKMLQIPVRKKTENNSFTGEEREKLSTIEEGAQRNAVISVNGKTGAVDLLIPSLTSEMLNDSGFLTEAPVVSVNGKTGSVILRKQDVGLGKVDNIALDDFTGSESIQIVGQVRVGEWQAEPVADAHVASSERWDQKLDDITGLVKVGAGLTIEGKGTPENPYTISGQIFNSMPTGGGSGKGVKSINGLKGDLAMLAGANIAINTESDGTITISSSGGGGSGNVPAGGNTNQILSKQSNSDYDTVWSDAPAGNSGMRLANSDSGVVFVYIGYEHVSNGSWYIYRRTVSDNTRLYASGISGYAAAWANRATESYS